MLSVRARRALFLERFEDRTVPAASPVTWPDPGHLTISFAPDLTPVGGSTSVLSQDLAGSGLSTAAWQGDILRAFQTWAAQTNIDLTVVPDNGEALGTPEPFQGSTRVGDIRIAAAPLSPDEVAVGVPPDPTSGWSGEVILNSNVTFTEGAGPAGTYDLYTTVLHEAGHALGLGDSTDPTSAMYENYQGPRTGLSAGDASAVQALYGVRVSNPSSGPANNSQQAAEPLQFVRDAGALAGTDPTQGPVPAVAAGSLNAPGQTDYYRFTVPGNATTFTAALRTSGISLLQAQLTLTDKNGNVLTPASTAGTGGDVQAVFNLARGGTYYLQVTAAAPGPFGFGSYRLAVGTDAVNAVSLPPAGAFHTPTGNVPAPLLGWGPYRFTELGPDVPAGDARWDYSGQASLGVTGETDLYHLHTTATTPSVLLATVNSVTDAQFDPQVTVYDLYGHALPTQVLSSSAAGATLQITGAQPNADYFVRVTAGPAGADATGRYFLGVAFRASPVQPTPFAAGTLRYGGAEQFITLDVQRTQLLHFQLSGQSAAQVPAALRMSIIDGNGNVAFTLIVNPGQTASGDVLLAPGSYTVRFAAATQDNSPLPAFSYQASFTASSDPVGPELVEDPTSLPSVPGTGVVWVLLDPTSYLPFYDGSLTWDIITNPLYGFAAGYLHEGERPPPPPPPSQ